MSDKHKDSNIEDFEVNDMSENTGSAEFDMDQSEESSFEQNETDTTEPAGDFESGAESLDPSVKMKTELAELKDKYLRLYADFENFRRRTAKESLELRKSAGQEILSALLPVLDDFDRAKQIADKPESTETFSEGMQLLYQKLQSTLKNKGLQKMDSNGEVFNPELHEAITEIPSPENAGKVIDTVEAGYMLNDKIIRYAKVVVGK